MDKFYFWKIESLWDSFFIEGKRNNYDLIFKNYSENKSIFIDEFFLVDKFDFSLSSKPVFYGEDREGVGFTEDKAFWGLKKQQLLKKYHKPVYLIDNHNKSIYPFLELKNFFNKELKIVHIDAHKDNSIYNKKVEKINLLNFKKYYFDSSISNYLDILLKGEVLKEIYYLVENNDFDNFIFPNRDFPIILNLDLDIFGYEGNMIELEKKVKFISDSWSKSDAIILAVSPGFFDLRKAEKIIKIFIEGLNPEKDSRVQDLI